MFKHVRVAVAAMVCGFLLTSVSNTAHAGGFLTEKVYRIEVEYLYWPAGISYWGVLLETTNEREANFTFAILQAGKAGGYLHTLVSTDSRFIPIDIRLSSFERPIPLPQFQEAKTEMKNLNGSRRPWRIFD